MMTDSNENRNNVGDVVLDVGEGVVETGAEVAAEGVLETVSEVAGQVIGGVGEIAVEAIGGVLDAI